LIVGFDGTEMSSQLSCLLVCIQPAGVILFARNIISPQQTYELLRACRKLIKIPAFLCVDLEGGLVDRLSKAIAPAPSPPPPSRRPSSRPVIANCFVGMEELLAKNAAPSGSTLILPRSPILPSTHLDPS